MVLVRSKVLLVRMSRMLRGRVQFLDRVLPLLFVLPDWGFDSSDTDVAGLDFSPECPVGSLGRSGSGDESGSGAEKPKRLPLNVVGLVWVVDC